MRGIAKSAMLHFFVMRDLSPKPEVKSFLSAEPEPPSSKFFLWRLCGLSVIFPPCQVDQIHPRISAADLRSARRAIVVVLGVPAARHDVGSHPWGARAGS